MSVCRGHELANALYSGINAAFDDLQKDGQTMNIIRFAVFAAFMQCPGDVKVVTRGIPTSRQSVTWWIGWLASAAEEDGERPVPTGNIIIYGSLLDMAVR